MLQTLDGILFFTLIDDHYILLEHLYKGDQIIGYNSLHPLPTGMKDVYASYNVADQRVLAAFLDKTRQRSKV